MYILAHSKNKKSLIYFHWFWYFNALKNNVNDKMLYFQHLSFFFHLNIYDLIKKKRNQEISAL